MPHLVRLRFVKIPYGILIPFVMSILMGETQMSAAHSAPISNLLISEVYYDTPGVDADEEWIELVNIGEVEINLSSYKIGDEELWGGGEGMMRFPEGATLQAGDTAIIAQTSRGFSAIFGRKPDFEFQNTDPDVPDMQPYRIWASGDIRLSNDGDEVLILDSANAKVDLVAYGDSDVNQDGIYEGTPVGGVFRGQSIERVPVNCDTNTSADWQPRRTPAPWEISFSGYCLLDTDDRTGQLLPIGAIQGRQDVASHVNQTVSFRGVVTGFLEDQNERGAIFHTIYVQDLPGHEDGDPHTSDGIAIFAGTTRPDIELGDIVTVTGMVTEFYGLTEIDDHNLSIEVESRGDLMPEPVEINPPPARDDADSYLEKFEGMLVELPQSVVVGPTHEGCGFAVVPADSGLVHIHHELDRQRLGFVVNVLHPSDVNCANIPSLNVGDVVNGLVGPLTYHFDRYKLVYQRAEDLEISPKDLGIIWQPPSLVEGQYSIASFNLNDYFGGDAQADIGSSASFRQDKISIKRDKYIYVIGQILSCPSILAVQEVENADLLHDLAAELDGECGFTYQVSHLDSPDARGIDVALLSDPRLFTVIGTELEQACTQVVTAVTDESVHCPEGQYPLFSRPPLVTRLVNEGEPLLVIVTHFKSKRGGAAETDEIRRSQASHLAEYVAGAVSESSMPAIILGDFNDYESSTSMEVLANEGNMTNSLEMIERSNRYTFIFDGERQLIDWIMVSASLRDKVVEARIAHLNSDFSYKLDQNVSPEFLALRSSDHDIPLIIVEWGEVSPEPIVVATDERSTTSKPTSTTIPVQEDGSIPGLTSSAEDRSLIIGGALALGIAVLSLLLVLKRRSQRF